MKLTLDYRIVTATLGERTSVKIKDYTDLDYDQWEQDPGDEEHPFFGVGHGDYTEEHGYSPKFVVWATIDGQLNVSKVFNPEKENFGGGETHGSLWGHGVTDRGYKGRYEPETGRLSIVKPERMRHREIPDMVMQQLESRFKKITEIRLF